MIPVAAITQGASLLAPILFGRPKKRKDNRNAIIQAYRNSRPAGYTTPEDQAAAARTQTRIAGAAQNAGRLARVQNARAVSARGLTGAAAAALEQGVTETVAAGEEEAARTSADQLYKAYEGNLGYERNKADTAFGAELGVASQQAAQNEARNATFWNSVLEAAPAIASAWGGQRVAGAAGATSRAVASPTYNPNVPGTFATGRRSPAAPAR